MKVFWTCDKLACQSKNYRTVDKNVIIIEDTCDYCEQYIREPITHITRKKPKNNYGKNSKDDR